MYVCIHETKLALYFRRYYVAYIIFSQMLVDIFIYFNYLFFLYNCNNLLGFFSAIASVQPHKPKKKSILNI